MLCYNDVLFWKWPTRGTAPSPGYLCYNTEWEDNITVSWKWPIRGIASFTWWSMNSLYCQSLPHSPNHSLVQSKGHSSALAPCTVLPINSLLKRNWKISPPHNTHNVIEKYYYSRHTTTENTHFLINLHAGAITLQCKHLRSKLCLVAFGSLVEQVTSLNACIV